MKFTKEKWLNYFKNERRIFFLISLVGFFVSVICSRNKIFWGDELITISCVKEDLKYIIGAASWNFIEYNPPLFNILAYFWIHIVPWNETTYLLFPIFCVALGMYFVGMTANEIGGRFAGIVAEVFGVFSSSVLVGVSLQFRPYALLFAASSITVYVFIHSWNSGKRNFRYYVIFGLAMALVAYSHNMGVFICVSCFLWDTLMFLCKKNSFTYVSSYIMAGVLYLPRLYTIFFSPYTPVSDPLSETAVDFMGYLLWVVGNQPILFVWFWFCVLLLVLSCRKEKLNIKLFFILSTIGIMLGLFFVGKIIPEHIYFTARFFTFMIPQVLVVMGLGTNEFHKKCLIMKRKVRLIIGVVTCLLVCFSIGQSFKYVKVNCNPQDFKTVGERIVSDSETMSDTIAVTSLTWGGGVPILDGLQYCYLRTDKNEYIDTIPYCQITQEEENEVLKYDKIYVVTIEGEHMEEQKLFLEKYYNKKTISNELELWVKK